MCSSDLAAGEFEHSLRMLSGDADLTVQGPRSGFDERLYPMLAARPEVAVASPVVAIDARPVGRQEALRVLGVDIFRASLIQQGLDPVGSTPAEYGKFMQEEYAKAARIVKLGNIKID